MENYPPHVNSSFKVESVVEKDASSKFTVKMMDAVSIVSIFMLFFGLPIFFTGLSLQGIVFEKQMYFYFWTLLALICWAGKGVLLGEMKIRRTPLDIPILLFWVVYLLATVISVDRWHSFVGLSVDPSRGFMNVTALVLVYYVIMSNFSEKMFRWIVGAITSSSLIVFVWSTLGILGVNFLPAKIAAYAPLSLLGTVSSLGIFLGIMLPIVITILFKVRGNDAMRKWLKNSLTVVLLLDLALNVFLLLALYGFVSWVVFMIGIGFFLIFILARIVRPIESWSWVLITTFILLMVIWMSGDSFKIVQINLPTEVSPAYNLSWQVAKDSVRNNFFLGTGAASYGYDFSLYKPQDFNLNQLYNLRFYQGTGIVFEALSTIGVIGILALALILLSFISLSVFYLIVRKEKDKVYSLGFVTAALIFLMSAVLNRVEGSLLIVGSLLAVVSLAVLIRESDSEERFLKLSLKASPKYALTLAFIFIVVSAGVAYSFVFVGKMYIADLYAGAAMRQAQVTEDGSIAKILRAANLNSKEDKYYTNIGQQYMVLANSEMLKPSEQRDVTAVQNYLNNSIMAVTHARDLVPNDVATVEALAQVYENAGMYVADPGYVADSLKWAEDTYNQALKLEPNNPNFNLELGKIKLSQTAIAKTDDEKKQLVGQAKDLFQKSIDEKNNFAPGYYQLALAQSALNDLDAAIETMGKAKYFDSANINYFFSQARLYQQRGKGDDNKTAEAIFKQILGVNDKEINTHFSLAMLYEKMNERDQAITEYNRVIELLPADNKDVTDKVKAMIENVKNGVSNLQTKAADVATESVQSAAPAQPAASKVNP